MEDEDLKVLTGFIDFTKSKGGKVQFTGLEKLNEEMKGKIGLDDKGMIDVSKMSTDEMSKLVLALKDQEKKVDSTKISTEDSIKAMKEQVNASINLSDQFSRMETQLKSLLPNLATIANDSGASKKIIELIDKTKTLIEKKDPTTGQTTKDKLETQLGDFSKSLIEKVGNSGTVLLDDIDKLMKNTNVSFEDLIGVLKTFKENLTKEKGGIVKKFNSGGVLYGPSHKDGGIPAYVRGSSSLLELEGGEAIINKKYTEMFKPVLSEINKKGGGIEFEKGGISKMNLDNLASKMSNNINIGSSTPITVNVKVDGNLKLDDVSYELTNEQKNDIMKTIAPKIMKDVNQQINQGAYLSSGKPTKPEFKWS
jgi:hypothetical protein